MLVVPSPASWLGRVAGNGHCVRFVQIAGNVPHTSTWRRGPLVRGIGEGEIVYGAVIATFIGGPEGYRYRNTTDGRSHVAVFEREDRDGLRVIDQWVGQPVHRRLIRFQGRRIPRWVNDGDRFYLVRLA